MLKILLMGITFHFPCFQSCFFTSISYFHLHLAALLMSSHFFNGFNNSTKVIFIIRSKNTFNIIIFFLKFTLNKVLQMQKNPLQNTKKYNFSIDTKSDGFHGDVMIQMKYLGKCSFYFRNNMILIEQFYKLRFYVWLDFHHKQYNVRLSSKQSCHFYGFFSLSFQVFSVNI